MIFQGCCFKTAGVAGYVEAFGIVQLENQASYIGYLFRNRCTSTTYITATLMPNILIKRTRLPRSTIGDEIKKEKVTPNGNPALVNPINNGIDEQLQNGVTVPSKAAMMFAHIP